MGDFIMLFTKTTRKNKMKQLLNSALKNNYIVRLVSKNEKIYLLTYRRNSVSVVKNIIIDKDVNESFDYIKTFCNQNGILLKIEN